jgi:hypothetical protein
VGGGALELKRGIEGGVDHWSVCHGTRGKEAALDRARRGGKASPLGWAICDAWAMQADWAKKPGRNSFEFKYDFWILPRL